MRTFFPSILVTIFLFALAGCASLEKPTAQVNQAVKMRYWEIQDANRERIPVSRRLPVSLPEHFEDGALRAPSTGFISLPTSP
ncbi:MAG: hypothetical protein Q8N18_05125 [Opitutaceae bacterium]|nr:hypothetical protein [Opitutaceae bacterium]